MSKKCTPLWREAHFQVKTYKAHHAQTTFGSWDVKKVHAIVARSTFPSQKCTKHTRGTDHLLDVQMSKKLHAVVARSTFPSQKCKKHAGFGPLFDVADVEKVHAVVARSALPSQNAQNAICTDHFWRLRCDFVYDGWDVVLRGRRKGLGPHPTVTPLNKTSGVCSNFNYN